MRKFQHVAVVVAAVVGLSALGAGVGFADSDDDGFGGVTAVPNQQANPAGTSHGADGQGGLDEASFFGSGGGFDLSPDTSFGK